MKQLSYHIGLTRLLLTSSAIACLACPAAGWSAEADQQQAKAAATPSPSELGDIIVTARKRSETAQNTPVAVTAYSAAQLERYNLSSLERIAESTPNLIISRGNSGGAVDIRLRGIGSSFTSLGVEQSVAVVVDGSYYGKGRVINEAFVDMSQVEVLKGPQALFYGKNATAGVISLTTNDPTNAFEAQVRTGYEFRTGAPSIEAIISGGLTDTLSARLVLTGSTMTRGYVRNDGVAGIMNTIDVATGTLTAHPYPAPPRWAPKDDNISGRLTLKYEPTSNFTAKLKLAHSYDHTNGTTWNAILVNCPVGGVSQVDPTQQCGRSFTIHQTGLPADVAASNDLYNRHGGALYNDYSSYQGTLQLDYRPGSFIISSNTNFQTFTNRTLGDYDYTSVPAVQAGEYSKWRAISQELRLLSDYQNPVNFMIGGYFQDTRLDFRQLVEFLGLDDSSAPAGDRYVTEDKNSYTDGQTISGFGQLMWKPLDKIELAGGIRYTHETKKSYFNQTYVNPALQAAFLQNVPVTANQTFDNWSPEATLTWKPDDDLTAYVAYKQNYKSGGFSNSSVVAASTILPNDLVFAPERVKGVEFGLKGRLANRTIRFDLNLFDYKFNNLQIDFFNSATSSFVTTNAGSATTKGAELSVEWLPPVEGLQISGSLNYDRARYNSFIAPCYAGQTIAMGCNLVVAGTPKQNLAGQPTALAPEFTASAGFNYERLITPDMKIGLSGTARYSSSYNASSFGNPLGIQKRYVNLDASVRLSTADERWQLALIGRNLTNRFVVTSSLDAGFSGGSPGGTTGVLADQNAAINPPRTVQIQASWRY